MAAEGKDVDVIEIAAQLMFLPTLETMQVRDQAATQVGNLGNWSLNGSFNMLGNASDIIFCAL